MFDDFSEAYEAMVDWPKRLANEAPFFRRWFERAGVQSVVDVACGTGRHAAMFRDWGLRVEGADIGEKMIALARANFGESDRLHWVVRGFSEPASAGERFDAAVCVGNSLALAATVPAAQQALRAMLSRVHDGGLVVVQVLNLWSLPDGPCVWQKCRWAKLSQGGTLILKGVHRCGTRGYVDLAVIPSGETVADGPASFHAESTPLLGFEAADLERFARDAGAREMAFFGGYQDQPYDREKSGDLIVVARK